MEQEENFAYQELFHVMSRERKIIHFRLAKSSQSHEKETNRQQQDSTLSRQKSICFHKLNSSTWGEKCGAMLIKKQEKSFVKNPFSLRVAFRREKGMKTIISLDKQTSRPDFMEKSDWWMWEKVGGRQTLSQREKVRSCLEWEAFAWFEAAEKPWFCPVIVKLVIHIKIWVKWKCLSPCSGWFFLSLASDKRLFHDPPPNFPQNSRLFSKSWQINEIFCHHKARQSSASRPLTLLFGYSVDNKRRFHADSSEHIWLSVALATVFSSLSRRFVYFLLWNFVEILEFKSCLQLQVNGGGIKRLIESEKDDRGRRKAALITTHSL